MNTKKFYSVFTVILVCFVFVLTSFIVSSEKLPLGSDTYFHLQLADFYSHGNLDGAFNRMFEVIHYPYPPFFQVAILGPVALSPDPYLGVRILEALFMPLTFLAAISLIWKHASPKAAFITGLTLLASWSFVDGALQCRPESLDLLLFSIITLAVLETKKKTAAISAAIMVWSHGFASLSYLVGFFIYKIKDKSWHKTFIYTIVAISPIIIISALYFGGAIQM